MATRLKKTLVDYMVIAISPALIMVLIGSLVYFLLEVLYHGGHQWRVHYIFTLFIFAAVLVARIAIEEGRDRAMLFMIVLGGATLLALDRWGEYGNTFVNLGLIALILWCADKLTWDSTVVDEDEQDSGKGLLQSIGLRKKHELADEPQSELPEVPEGLTSHDMARLGLWQSFVRRRRRAHAPGVWVVYFSLAALPLFGFGQLLIPATQTAQRQYVFALLVIYVAASLGLLLTTSFLGLRRYLRQHQIAMPLAMAGVWLTIGSVLIVAILALALFLPRPGGKYAFSLLPYVQSETTADDSAEEDASQDDSQTVGLRDGDRSGQGVGPQESTDEEAAGPSEDSGDSGTASTKPGSRQRDGSGKSDTSDGRSQQNTADAPQDPGQDAASGSEDRAEADAGGDQGESPAEETSAEAKSESQTSPARNDGSSSELAEELASRSQGFLEGLMLSLGGLFRFVIYWVLILAAAYALWRYRWAILSGPGRWLEELRAFLRGLFGGRGGSAADAAEEDAPRQPPPQHFADFADPFSTGAASRLAADELVRYSFDALQAWAEERGFPRGPDQTPHEFARNVGDRVEALAGSARSLADLYCRVAYAPGTVRAASTAPLKQLWQSFHEPIDVGAEGEQDRSPESP